MGSITKDWETILAESTTKDSDITPGVALAAVNKNGKNTFDSSSASEQFLSLTSIII
jgi:hypothetical protein